MPASHIETLSQGTFFGKVADNNDCKIARKFFCREIQIDNSAQQAKRSRWEEIPVLTDFGTEDREEIRNIIMANYRKIKKDIEDLLINEAVRIAAKGVAGDS